MTKTVEQPGLYFAGVGSALPEGYMTNEEIAALIKSKQPADYEGPETTPEWIKKATWIETRPISDPAKGETTGSLGEKAGFIALENSGFSPASIEVLVFATTTPDDKVPATASWVQEKLGLDNAYAFDINAACPGFVFGAVVLNSLMRTLKHKRGMLIAADTLDNITDLSDRVTGPLFSSGAGAIVVETTDENRGIIGVDLISKGNRDLLYCPHYEEEEVEVVKDGNIEKNTVLKKGTIKMPAGRPVFEAGSDYMANTLTEAMRRADVTQEELKLLVLHQANGKMMKRVVKLVGIDQEKMAVSVDHIGNSSSATIPITLHEAMQKIDLMPGDLVGYSAAGAGLNGGSIVQVW